MISASRITAALAALVTVTTATVSYNPISTGPAYSLSIPQSTASSGDGDFYLQLSAPSSYSWAGMGIGSQMAGATIFVMYADGNGNVTISPRRGTGHVEPQVDSTLQVQLLAGSGVSGGVMTANVLCSGCASRLSSTTASSSGWIAAWNQGSAIDSTETDADIRQHAGNGYRTFTFDLTQAVVAENTNPFVTGAATSSTATSSATGGTATSTGSADAGNSGSTGSGSDSDSNTGSGSSSGASETGGGDDQAKVPDYQKAHGIIMGLTVVLLLPIGALLIRVGVGLWLHVVFQILSMAMLIAGFGTGIKLADLTQSLYESDGRTHTIFGTVLVGLFLVQPFLGMLQHRSYVKTQKRSIWGLSHQWYGRILMILAVINGGLGLKLADNTTKGEIAYGVIAGAMGLIYIAIVLLTSMRKRKNARSAI